MHRCRRRLITHAKQRTPCEQGTEHEAAAGSAAAATAAVAAAAVAAMTLTGAHGNIQRHDSSKEEQASNAHGGERTRYNT